MMADGGLPSWSEYQEEVADFFRALGLTADTNVTVAGVRTSHDIDVRVSAHFAGVDLLWVVECKQWKRRVTKNHVLALHTIIQEIGADRGFMMAENGYQAGAVEAAASSNITLTSLAELSVAASNHLTAYRIETIGRRLDRCSERLAALHITTRRTATSTASRTLSGAGDAISLYGTIGIAQNGMQSARLNRLPATYGFMADRTTRHVARTMQELLDGLQQITDELEADLTEREKRVSIGPDAHLWQQ